MVMHDVIVYYHHNQLVLHTQPAYYFSLFLRWSFMIREEIQRRTACVRRFLLLEGL